MSASPPVKFQSGSIARLYEEARLYAAAPWPILIIGGRGAGKTMLAKWIHEESRRSGNFVKVSAPSIPPSMEYAYLAGHNRGAFTGASVDSAGFVEAANRGTLFLDELGLASEPVQRVLLQLLDDRTVTRLGDRRPRPVDVRFIGATNEDLDVAMAAGGFRRDLRDRFGRLVLRVPSLAERRDEIVPLATRFMTEASDQLGRLSPPPLSEPVREVLRTAAWPGNVRELIDVCRYLTLHAVKGSPVTLDQLPPDFALSAGQTPRRRITDAAIHNALEEHQGNRTKAAASLGMSREHLHRRMRRS